MTRIEKLNKIQEEAIQAWIDNNCNGTLYMATGTGKTITSIKAMYKVLPLGSTIRFWAETLVRKITLFEDEKESYLKHYNKDFTTDYNIIFKTYQSGPDTTFADLDIFDEIDFALTRKYLFSIKDSNSPKKMGLTGSNNDIDTVNKEKIPNILIGKIRQADSLVKEKKINTTINKSQLLTILCPIVYKYNLKQAIEDGILNKFETTILAHHLNDKNKYLFPFKSSSNPVSELNFYSSLEKIMHKKSTPIIVKEIFGRKLSNFLVNDMLSKQAMLRLFLKRKSNSRILIFGVKKELLRNLTPNVVEKDNFKNLIHNFNNFLINIIASAKYLKRGLTPKGIDILLIASYYSTSQDLLQTLGRAIRFQSEEKVVQIYIFKTHSTYEVDWFNKFTKVYNSDGSLDFEIPLNVVRTLDTQLIKNIKYEI